MRATTATRSLPRPLPRAVALPLALLLAMALAPGGGAAQAIGGVCPDQRPWTLAVGGEAETQEITLVGGARYTGRVLDVADPVRFELMSADVLEIAHERIACLRVIPGTRVDGEFWHEDPNTTRLFFGPTGRSLGRGEGYFSVVEILMPFLSFGITDRFTVSGGTPLIFTSEGPQVIWLAPKLQVIRTGPFDASIGVLGFLTREVVDTGILYAVGTWGRTPDRALTLGVGWGYDTDVGIHDTPALMVGGEARMTRGTKFITENYFFPAGDFAIISAGPRFFGEKLTADLGLAMPIMEDAELFVFPLINFAWNW